MDKIDDGFGDEVFNTPLQPYTPVGTPGPSASSGGSRFDKASPYGRFDKDKPSKEMQDKMKTNEMDWQMECSVDAQPRCCMSFPSGRVECEGLERDLLRVA